MQPPRQTIFIVDDDLSICRSLSRLVRQAGMEARTFPSAEAFLESQTFPLLHPACLVLDLRMPGLGGLDLQVRLATGPAPYSIIFISGNGDIPATVQAMKHGAVTFLTKPFETDDLLRAITEALAKHRLLLAAASESGSLQKRLVELTDREHEVMTWVITGALNKQIAAELGVVEQTIKVHRSRVMEKMHVTSVAELVWLCASAGIKGAVVRI